MEPLRFPPDTTASQVLDAIEQWARTTTAMENSLLWSVLSCSRDTWEKTGWRLQDWAAGLDQVYHP